LGKGTCFDLAFHVLLPLVGVEAHDRRRLYPAAGDSGATAVDDRRPIGRREGGPGRMVRPTPMVASSSVRTRKSAVRRARRGR
jgi:hypothetical protein